MNTKRLDVAMLAICIVWAAVVLPRAFTGKGSPELEQTITWVGGLLRVALLLLAAGAASRAARGLDRDNPARWSQFLLAGGFLVYVVAQGTLFGLTLSHGKNPPYPSIADLGYFASMLLLIIAVATAIRSWLELGLFPDGGRRAVIAGLVTAIPLLFVAVFTIRSLDAAASTPLQEAADLSYLVLDSILLILTVAMLRLSMQLGKGSVGVVWRSLLLGFLAMAVGDVVYSFFTGFELEFLDPVLDVLYTVSYALMARGAVLQLWLLRESHEPSPA